MKAEVYRLRGSASYLLRRLEAAQKKGEESVELRRRFEVWAAAGGLLSFVGSFLAFWPRVLLGFAPALLSLLLTGHRLHPALDRHKLSALSDLLKMVRESAEFRDQGIRLVIDFRDYFEGGRLIETRRRGAGDTLCLYHHGWLDVRGALAAGADYRLILTEKITRVEIANYKGIEAKQYFEGHVNLEMHLVSSSGAEELVDALAQASPPQPLRLTRLRSQARRVMVRLSMPPAFEDRIESSLVTSSGRRIAGDTLVEVMQWVSGLQADMKGEAVETGASAAVPSTRA